MTDYIKNFVVGNEPTNALTDYIIEMIRSHLLYRIETENRTPMCLIGLIIAMTGVN